MKPLLFVAAVISFSSYATAQQDVPTCSKNSEERPFELNISGQPISKLPNSLFVAKKADIWVESENSGQKFWVTHNFKTGMKEFNCATLTENKQRNFTFFGPVIYDNSTSKKEGSTVWQFQVLLRGMQLGIWNQKSSLVKIDQIMNNQGSNPWRWVEENAGTVRLYKTEKSDGFTSVLVIDLEKAQ